MAASKKLGITEVDPTITKKEFKTILKTLVDRDQKIIQLRLIEGLILQDVGKKFGITRERVRQLQNDALLKMRRAFKALRNPQPSIMDSYNLSIQALNLSVRSENTLTDANILTVGQLRLKTVSELLEHRYFDKKVLRECRDALLKLQIKVNWFD